MHILWVKVGGLLPLNTGGRLRSFHILSELSRKHQVTLFTTHGPNDDPAALAARLPHCREIVSIPYDVPKRGTARFAAALLRSWLSSLPVDLAKVCVGPLRRQVGHLLRGHTVDLCVADFLAALPNIPRDTDLPLVLFAHNAEHMIWKRLWEIENRAWRRALLGIEWRKMRRYEAQACRRASLTIAVSEVDRARLAANAPGAVVRSVPTGVDTSFFTRNGSREAPASLVFTGSMDWYPNEEAALHFVSAVLPRIRREVPEASLTIVGRNPTSRLWAAMAEAGVRLTGTVDDVRPYVAEAAVCVVPLRVGGGTRLKIFEALAMGKAVVSTAVGAEGLPLVPGQHYLRADEPDDFARAVVSLLRDPARRQALGAAGHRLVKERYSWTQVAKEFEARCKEAVRNHAG